MNGNLFADEINIQFKLKGQEHIAILPGNNNIKPTDLAINYVGIRLKNEKAEKEDDDNEIESEMTTKKRKTTKTERSAVPLSSAKTLFSISNSWLQRRVFISASPQPSAARFWREK